MKFLNLLPAWAQPVFLEAGLELKFEEQKMNCSSCSFAAGDFRDGSSLKESFAEKLKCCTFFPDLANFTAGYELRKNSAVFDHLIEYPKLSLPLGIMASDSYKDRYSKASFGNDETLLCPHFNRTNQNCGIWASRPSSCVRFVCKSSLGEVGQNIWSGAETVLHSLETNLAYEAALQLGFVNYEIHSKEWSASPQMKKDFYLRAADFVDSLTNSQKMDLAGEEFTKARSQLQSLAASASL